MRAVFEGQGAGLMAKQTLAPEVYERMIEEHEVLIGELNQGTDGRVVIENEYLRVVADKSN